MTPQPQQPPVVVVMGVTGTAKSTLAAALAERLRVTFQEGDDLHSASNVAKMASGHPLTDADRDPWLDRVAGWIAGQHAAGLGGVVTCSSLRRAYRDRLRAGAADGAGVLFLHLRADRDAIAGQLAGRSGHFMDPALLDSQLAILEALASDEDGFEISSGRDEDAMVADALDALAQATTQPR